ncbi:hypothetical protein [Chryseolinea sp. H1M3-3]|uniref:hypothetical protein n=1 Tax=Chryseolinea sp. H1M3-3 TaxID=3034144 RepID=UPI0023EBF606|nr:hypothetical protein [Chryseolinea sp. H1M3-3]
MNNYQKFGLISGQVLMGLLFGFVGAIVTTLTTILYFEVRGQYLDLFPEVLSAVIGCYLGIQIGIGYNGFKFLKQKGKQQYFPKFFFQSTGGLILGLMISYFLTISPGIKMSEAIVNCLGVALPLTGSIIGFDLGLLKRVNDN